MASLAHQDQNAFVKFFKICNFNGYFGEINGHFAIVDHLIGTEKVDDLFALARYLPNLKAQIGECFESIKKEDFSKVVSIIANHLTRNPEHFNDFFPNANSPEGICVCCLCRFRQLMIYYRTTLTILTIMYQSLVASSSRWILKFLITINQNTIT